jgi:hypothetical protein
MLDTALWMVVSIPLVVVLVRRMHQPCHGLFQDGNYEFAACG